MVLSFLIALFVLTMQFFWLYIDEIMGKGVSILQIIELVSYLTVSFVPLALPMGVLLASVMVFGNLGERYELSSMKSAGVSLTRIMAPLALVSAFVAIVSFLSSNYIIPKSNLKFLTRLYDIRRQKPALAIEPGVFNDDFFGYSIYVGKKLKDKKSIEDIIVYDQSQSSDRILCTTAKTGMMYTTDHGNRFVLELYNGEEVEEPPTRYREGGYKNYPLMRTRFTKYVKSFDLQEFDINATDESRFSDNQKMLSNRQLLVQIDTIRKLILSGEKKVGLGITKMFDDKSTTAYVPDQHAEFEADSLQEADSSSKKNVITGDKVDTFIAGKAVPGNSMDTTSIPDTSKSQAVDEAGVPEATRLIDSINSARGVEARLHLDRRPDSVEIDLQPGVKVAHLYELLDSARKGKIFKETGTAANLVQSEIINVLYTLQSYRKKEVLHWQQYYQKITLALACIIFMFIGAPMGAIVRKGGFGYPLLIAIIFFIVYIMGSKMFEKFTDSFVLNVHIGMWLTTLIISLCGLYLTYRASRDMSSNVVSNIQEKLTKWFSPKKKNRETAAFKK